jgi:hypothetical protein
MTIYQCLKGLYNTDSDVVMQKSRFHRFLKSHFSDHPNVDKVLILTSLTSVIYSRLHSKHRYELVQYWRIHADFLDLIFFLRSLQERQKYITDALMSSLPHISADMGCIKSYTNVKTSLSLKNLLHTLQMKDGQICFVLCDNSLEENGSVDSVFDPLLAGWYLS